MIREKRGRTSYYLECDRCNIQSTAALSKEGALRLAREAGWRIEERWNGLIRVSHHLCPWCRRDAENAK